MSGAERWLASLPQVGETAALVRSHDWCATPLGPVREWSVPLRTVVGAVLRSRFPMLVCWGPELVQVYNDAFLPTYGGKHPQIGERISDTWAEIWDVIGPMMQGVVTTGEATWEEDLRLVVERGNGREEAFFTFSYSPAADADGLTQGVLVTAVETTGQVVATRRLKLLNELSSVAADATTLDGLMAGVGTCLSAHPADIALGSVRLQGHAEGGPAARVWREAASRVDLAALPDGGLRLDLPGEEPDGRRLVVAHPLRGGEAGDGALLVVPHPERPWDAPHAEFLQMVAQQVSHAIASVAARETQGRRLEELAALDRAKRDFLSDVSHELRTPLTLISGPLHDLQGRPDLPAEVREDVRVALRGADRLTRLVDALLDYSRAHAGVLTVATVALDLPALVQATVELFRPAASRAGIRLELETGPLPEPVLADPVHLETVLVNLLANALKFTAQGEVRVTTRSGPLGAVIEVRDTGAGIAPEDLPHVFERFRRGREDEVQGVEGTGIGLSLVQELVALQGGTVDIDSLLGAGTTVRLVLPWAPEAEPVTRAAPGPAALAASRDVGGGGDEPTAVPVGEEPAWRSLLPRVVLAEDNDDVREFVSRVLYPHVRVEAFSDGAAALAALRSRPPELLLTDVRMPVLGGMDLLAEVRRDPVLGTLPVLLFSAHADREAAVAARQAGADDYLVKPFTPADLVARVRSTIDLVERRRQAALLRAYRTPR